ncbi:MAG TPA: DUF2100 domain-containing protein [Methanobacterium sp.]|nr:DUF2100 domain-containing protein [Methanobacterium sp.]
MDEFRFKQAQNLIMEAGKIKETKEVLKKPQEGVLDSKLFGEILNEIIELEEYIYTSRPTHYLKKEEAQSFCEGMINIRNQIDEILADFGVLEKVNLEDEIRTTADQYLILTTKSNFKKALGKFNVDPQKIVVAGVPLTLDDMKKLNPHLPDHALASIEKKIDHVKNDIKRKKEQFNLENVLVVVENDKTGQTLVERAEEQYNARIIMVDVLKDLTAPEFLKMLKGL